MERTICVYLEYLTDELRRKIADTAGRCGFSVRFCGSPEDARAALPSCEVLFAHSPELVRAAPAALRWYCCAFAGVDPYCRGDGIFKNPDCILTNSAGAYGVTVAEHIVTAALMLLRRMPEYAEIVRRRDWENDLPIRSLWGSRITVLGAGDIGSAFARRARAFQPAAITGVSRSGKAREPVFDTVVPMDRLDGVLPETELLVMALPSTASTVGIMSRERIALLPRRAVVINVGRGTALDQDALAEALNSGALAGAALDVMTPEPLPKDHPLWETRNLLLTPHVAGNMTLGYTCRRTVELFCENLERYAAGRPMSHVVDRTRGY
ncbi:MAG: D-2-hydroxyacid dehydrogenase [Oscillibacter sp.]|jgi:phosphoglycerate dehydrogenase-like enzyme|nr:D-2-hydroxyacid dehydrogenase [Oscillibacter sp.]